MHRKNAAVLLICLRVRKQRVDAFRSGAAPPFHVRAATEEDELLPFESCQIFLYGCHTQFYSLLTGFEVCT